MLTSGEAKLELEYIKEKFFSDVDKVGVNRIVLALDMAIELLEEDASLKVKGKQAEKALAKLQRYWGDLSICTECKHRCKECSPEYGYCEGCEENFGTLGGCHEFEKEIISGQSR